MAEYEKKVREKLKEFNCEFVRRGKGDYILAFLCFSLYF